ncbi:hypothetical protein ECTPHS_07142 [Ectothiorhodospira sp. PHS-1]|uniref:sensor domain-containing diguanylate cyclase n=1 Tax=Ectothiorhodospira sp. PHS-1 TaxID=519989 RepID=UPI00024A8908|nr:sensor domain-containing diguanylate cyclase [Ectothiorhodospira sp. PHS-1]EHQ52449.1 hypothetical protein ECTPHS_07142 [Ectothiorhodospira sp. PHS-1]
MSLQKTLFGKLLLLTLAMVILLGSLVSVVLYHSGLDSAQAVIRNKNLAAAHHIRGYVQPLRSVVQYLAAEDFVREAMDTDYRDESRLLELFRVLQDANPTIHFIFAAYEDGRLVINDYVPPPGFDPRVRPWYEAGVRAGPALSGGIPYREIKSDEWLVSFSQVLLDEDGGLRGVVAIDALVDAVMEVIGARDPSFTTARNLVLDHEGRILFHAQDGLIGTRFAGWDSLAPMVGEGSGQRFLEVDQRTWMVQFIHEEPLNWTVVTMVEKREVLLPIMWRILQSVAVVLCIALLLSAFMARNLSAHIVGPLRLLEQRVRDVVDGKALGQTRKSVPLAELKNEIGTISQAIEAVTEHALYQKNQELQRNNALLERLSQTDSMTGLMNRRKMNEQLEQEYSRVCRYQGTFVLMLFDIDHFKQINDTHGHHVGDLVLQELAALVRGMVRATDSVARWGGEEFLILFPETDQAAAMVIAEKIRAAIAAHRFPVPRPVTVSIGICQHRPDTSLQELLIAADKLLYQAKSGGRNRICVGDSE